MRPFKSTLNFVQGKGTLSKQGRGWSFTWTTGKGDYIKTNKLDVHFFKPLPDNWDGKSVLLSGKLLRQHKPAGDTINTQKGEHDSPPKWFLLVNPFDIHEISNSIKESEFLNGVFVGNISKTPKFFNDDNGKLFMIRCDIAISEWSFKERKEKKQFISIAVRNSKRNPLKLKILSQFLTKGVPIVSEVMIEQKDNFINLTSFASTEVIRGIDSLAFSKAYQMAKEDAELTEETEETEETENTTFSSSSSDTKNSDDPWNNSSSDW
jgi:hypothetical protein